MDALADEPFSSAAAIGANGTTPRPPASPISPFWPTLNMERMFYMENNNIDLAAQLTLANAVIQKYVICCRLCRWRDCCDYEINAECNFVWDGVSI